jgi:hypothetical protein
MSAACFDGRDARSTRPFAPDPLAAIQAFGSIQVTTLTSGTDVDPNGYTIVVNDVWDYTHPPVKIASNGVVTLRYLPPRTQYLQLYDVAANCTGKELEDRPIVVEAHRVVATMFEVTCTLRDGSQRRRGTQGVE